MGSRDRARDAARLILGPIWRRVWARIENRLRPIDERQRLIEERIQRMERLDAAWDQHVPTFLNAVATVGAFGHELATLRRQVMTIEATATTLEASSGEPLARIADRIGLIEERIERLDAAWGQQMPTLLNAVEMASALGSALTDLRRQVVTLESKSAGREGGDPIDSQGDRHWTPPDVDVVRELDGIRTQLSQLANTVERLATRVEFVRSETLYEARYGSGDPASRHYPPESAKRKERLDLTGPDLRLNLGCGHLPMAGYVNVDRRALPGVDLVANVDNIPVEPDSVAEIHSAHLLEHFPQEALRRQLLPYWRSLLRPDGLFRAVVPDGSAMLAGLAEGSYTFEAFRLVLFGAQDYAGDFHYNLLTPVSLSDLLVEAGFSDVVIPARGRPNGSCFEFEIVGRKPSSDAASAARGP